MEWELTDHFNIDVDGFARLIQDNNVLAAQTDFMDHIRGRRTTAFKTRGHLRYRTVQYELEQRFPGFGRVILEEKSIFSPRSQRFWFEVAPKGMERMVSSEGIYLLEREGRRKMRRRVLMALDVKVPGMAGMLGKMMEDNLTQFMAGEAQVIREAIKGNIRLGPKRFVPPILEKPYRR